MALSILAGNTVEIPSARAGMRLAASRLLRIGVVLIGLRVALDDLAAIGLPGLVVVMMVLSVTFFGTQWIGRPMGISPDLSLLVGTGYSICGVSAVAAMNGVIRADEEEAAYAIGLVTLAGSLSIVVLPLLGTVVGMTPGDFGTWVGGAVHDVAQTVATASTNGDEALTAAIVVKLTRVALLDLWWSGSPSPGDAALPWRVPPGLPCCRLCGRLSIDGWSSVNRGHFRFLAGPDPTGRRFPLHRLAGGSRFRSRP
ncbi:MAG TPA: putative sulfate exporter family transporter, partial [Acidimicrobiia bacterium]|nr:putative sulfate exporter family transporter [Acidimicrobiia bacterium]